MFGFISIWVGFGVWGPLSGAPGDGTLGDILVRRDPPLGPFARNTVMGGTPWEGKKTAKT